MEELWKKLEHPFVDDIYEISPLGNIRDDYGNIVKDVTTSTNGYLYCELKSSVFYKQEGYKYDTVRLCVDDLVAESFITIPEALKPNTLLRLNHKDGNKLNVASDNLEWCENVEIWKLVVNSLVVPMTYQISSLGKLRNIKTGYEYSIIFDRTKRPLYNLKCKDGRYIQIYVKYLLAEAFVEGKKTQHDMVRLINHINSDISLKNIEWFTPNEDGQEYPNERWVDLIYGDVKRDMYLVSSYGRVKNKHTRCILKPMVNKGYLYVKLMRTDCNSYKEAIHRIVCTMFNGDSDGLPHVNHIDGNKHNNYYTNLEWCTPKENVEHAIRTGLTPPVKRGEESGNAKISERDAEEICRLIVIHKGNIHAIMNDITNTTITRKIIEGILYKLSWRHVSDKYFNKGDFCNVIPHAGSKLSEELVEEVCKSIIRNYGDTRYVILEFEDNPDLSSKVINNIKNKRSWKSVSDKFFSIEDLRILHEKKIRMIKTALCKYNGDIQSSYDELISDLPYLTKGYLSQFKNDEKYFPKNFFKDDRLSE